MRKKHQPQPPASGEKSPLRLVVEDFMLSREAMALSDHTIKHYAKTLKIFLHYLETKQADVVQPADLGANHIKAFYAWARRKKKPVEADEADESTDDMPEGADGERKDDKYGGGYAPYTVFQLGTDVRAFCNWLAEERDDDRNLLLKNGSPHANVKLPKKPDQVLPPFSDGEIARLYEATKGTDWLRVRDRALLLFLLDCAIRRAECQQITIEQLDLDEGSVTIERGKGGSTRQAVFQKTTCAAIRKYLRVSEMQGKDDDDPLWWGKYGPLTLDGIGEVFQKICERAKVKGSPHKARRTAAIKMLRSGASLEDVRRLLGHRDYQCIMKYLAYVKDDLKRAHDRHSPVESLDFINKKKNVRAGKKRNGKTSR